MLKIRLRFTISAYYEILRAIKVYQGCSWFGISSANWRGHGPIPLQLKTPLLRVY